MKCVLASSLLSLIMWWTYTACIYTYKGLVFLPPGGINNYHCQTLYMYGIGSEPLRYTLKSHIFCNHCLDMSHAHPTFKMAFMQDIESNFTTSLAAIQYICHVVTCVICPPALLCFKLFCISICQTSTFNIVILFFWDNIHCLTACIRSHFLYHCLLHIRFEP